MTFKIKCINISDQPYMQGGFIFRPEKWLLEIHT